ncbi:MULTISPECIES: hypothetical protein [Idiomarina]|uniref:hypothetical protein n=1 Tax=Idiomarina TaxID=135575 RepID=UPI00129B6339|nr:MULTISPECIES: hypothetical protein [Idiomarina]MRJ40795.1 hypothetical protein [Idiomarina sp. FeN1]NCU56599.1 hypothetical protein [Idiomarina sp. FenA--70]NCU58979.1 hypothetical protein [Idiomarina sp. FenBw--71]UUN14524.1 hypothetical protein KGF88_04735 [Idiomarina loihiensis]
MATSMNDLLNDANCRIQQMEMERFHERASLVMMATLLVQAAFERSGVSIDAVTAKGVERVDLVDVNLVLAELRKLAFAGTYSQEDVHNKVVELSRSKRDRGAAVVRQAKIINRMKTAHDALLEDFDLINSAIEKVLDYRIAPKSELQNLSSALNMMRIHLGGVRLLLKHKPALDSVVVIRKPNRERGQFLFDGRGQLKETVQ